MLSVQHASIERCAFQLEKAPRTGHLHWQGFLYTVNAVKCKFVHDVIGPEVKAWIQPAKGSPQQCWEYSTKEKTRVLGPWTYGTPPPGAGKRTDLWTFEEAVKSTFSDPSVVVPTAVNSLRDTFVPIAARLRHWFNDRVASYIPSRSVKTLCVVLTGAPGTGKTVQARNLCRAYGCVSNPYPIVLRQAPGQSMWFDNYLSPQYDPRFCILDEFVPSLLSQQEFNLLVDATPHQVPFKGGWYPWICRLLVITSNYDLMEFFPALKKVDNGRLYGSTLRRVEYHAVFDYDPAHVPNADFSNGLDVATHALIDLRKNTLPPSL